MKNDNKGYGNWSANVTAIAGQIDVYRKKLGCNPFSYRAEEKE